MAKQQEVVVPSKKKLVLAWDKYGALHTVPKEPRQRFLKARRILQ